MSDYFSSLQSSRQRRTSRRRGRGQSSLADLNQQVAVLEQRATELGASAPETDSPGIFARLVDVLSRPNYAIAGAADEILSGNGITKAFGRAVNELLSGVGPLEGDKRAWGQVLERNGFGTVTLGDVVPYLDGTWVGNFGSRGAVGLALDIFTDPLTYLTLGTSSAGRIVTSKGVRWLNKSGLDEWGKLSSQAFESLKGISDPVKRAAQAVKDAEVQLFAKYGDDAGRLAREITDAGGIKFFGRTVVSGDRLRQTVAEPLRKALLAVPGGEEAIKGAVAFSEGMKRGINGLFGPNGELANLPEPIRAGAIRLSQDFRTNTAMHRGRARNILKSGLENGPRPIRAGLADRYSALQKADEDIGRKFYSIAYQAEDPKFGKTWAVSDLSDDAKGVYEDFVNLARYTGDTLVSGKVLDAGDLRSSYLPVRYLNPEEEMRQLRFLNDSPVQPSVRESFTKSKVFDNPFEAIEMSTRLNQISKTKLASGKTDRLYPVLNPSFDVLDNFNRYIDSYADALARQAWREQAAIQFGKNIDASDLDDLFRITRGIKLSDDEAAKVSGYFGSSKKFKDLIQDEADRLRLDPKADRDLIEGTLLDGARKTLRGLSDDGKREFMQQMVLRAKSSSQLASMMDGLWDEFGEFVPRATASAADVADASYAKLFGNDAVYVPVKSKFTGDEGALIPKIIWDDMQRVRSTLLNTKDYKEFGRLLRGFDTINNLFKLGTYTFWPASLTRDAYSNVALSFLDIGVGALNPKSHMDTVGIMAGRSGFLKVKGGGQYAWEDLRKLARDLGVWVPGETFVELTGDAAKTGPVTRGLKKLANYRGLVENEARMQLWIQNIRRGVDPRNAADHVRQFLFDYGALSGVERSLFRRLFPYYTFTRKNIELQAKALIRTPGRSVNQLKPFRQRHDESESMVKWEAEALAIRLDRDGKTVHMLTGIDLPLRNLDTLWPGTPGGSARRVLGMLTPVLKVPLETTTNVDFFTGGSLDRASGPLLGRVIEMANTPKPIRDWIGYKKTYDEAGRPSYTFDGRRYALLVRSWAFSRFFSTADRQFRDYVDKGDVATQRILLDLFVGVREKEVDMDEQQRRRLQRRIRALEESLVRRGGLGRYSRAYGPREEAEF